MLTLVAFDQLANSTKDCFDWLGFVPTATKLHYASDNDERTNQTIQHEPLNQIRLV